MAASTPQNYRVQGQAPLDAKMTFTNVAAFNALRLENPAYAFDFYKGMMVYFKEEEKTYIWENPFSDNYKENKKLLTENFIYPIGSIYEDYDYSFKAFNLIELPYNIVNIGVWDVNGDPTVEVNVYENSTENPFVIADVIALWPDVERIAFVGGDITGLKLAGQPLQLFQEFNINDWDDLSYDIWNNTDGFVQNAKLRIVMPGEIVDYTQYLNQITGNSFKESAIVHSEADMRHENSIYFKPVGSTFEIHVVDKLKVKRAFISQSGGGVADIELAFSGANLQILDSNSQVITQVSVGIQNVVNLENSLNDKLPKPTGNMSTPDLDFKFLVLVDEQGQSRRILASYFDSGSGIGNIVGTVNEIKIIDQGSGVIRVALEDNVTIPNDLTVLGNFIVKGDTTIIDTEQLKVEDNIITLNSNVVPPQQPVLNSGIEISRGVEDNVYLIYNELIDRWQFSNDGSVFYNIPTPDEYALSSFTASATITSLNETVTHTLNTMKVMVQLYNTATGQTINSDHTRISNTQIRVEAFTDYTAPIMVLMIKIA